MVEREKEAAEAYRSLSSRIHATLPSSTYSDTPIDDSEDRSAGVPEKIKQMRSLLSADDVQTFSEAYIFVCQARFMEDYADDYEYTNSQTACNVFDCILVFIPPIWFFTIIDRFFHSVG